MNDLFALLNLTLYLTLKNGLRPIPPAQTNVPNGFCMILRVLRLFLLVLLIAL